MRIRSRIVALHEAEVARWRQAWESLNADAWRRVETHELRLFVKLRDLWPVELPFERVSPDVSEEEFEVWRTWFVALGAEMPRDGDAELKRYPEALDEPPEDLPDLWERARTVAASDAPVAERMAAAWCLVVLAWGMTSRHSHRTLPYKETEELHVSTPCSKSRSTFPIR